VRPEVEAASDRSVQERFAGTAWTRCDSWYRDERGRVIANWPGYMREYFEQTRTLRVSDYRFLARARAPRSADGDAANGAAGSLTRGAARAPSQNALADA